MVPDLTGPDESIENMLYACKDRIDKLKEIV